MTRRIYANAAEKQRAYRERHRDGHGPAPSSRPKPRRKSRPERLEYLESEIRTLAEEYQDWLGAMPENLTEGRIAEELQEVIDQLQAIADDLAAIEPPRIGRARNGKF